LSQFEGEDSMAAAKSRKKASKQAVTGVLPVAPEAQEKAPAWELVEAGRYMPRRIKGSCLGRELG
jgi:hypothetical protein